ncbi:hypothetical protein EVJ58_g3763 [Rhodofomes roseus]|uniref:Aldehyde dehydrogenase n=1 Tax=Rhodofomes roseus TaxID=34475 RepID=A0A4Y9YNM3_9APHY|nr:hypothetical protein EVJ58_g3763 [Rhodofomes roseus]
MSTSLVYTPVDEIPQIHQSLKQAFASGKSKDVHWRKQQILKLWHLVEDNLDGLRKALYEDLGRAPDESDGTELNSILLEIKNAYDNVGKWTQTERASWHYMWFAMSPATRIEPKGVVLIITPFNFPLYLCLAPLAAVIAAGDACLLKPSEGAPACASLLADLFPKYMDQDFFRVVNGAIPETTKLLELQWDHMMAFPSKFYTLICMSPDYAIVPEHFQEPFIEACKEAYYEMHPKDPKETGNMARIVNERHAKRVKRLLDNTKGQVVLGGNIDMDTYFCEATIVKDVKLDDILMSEEIFAPILPVIPVKDVDEAIKTINSLGHSLVLHVFSSDSAFKKKVFDNTQSGLAVANETLLHIQTVGIPFGGVGASGYGATTGKAAFDQFVHRRGSIDSPFWLDPMMLFTRYPPYTQRNKTVSNMFMHPKPPA